MYYIEHDILYNYSNGVKQNGNAPGPLGEPLRDNKRKIFLHTFTPIRFLFKVFLKTYKSFKKIKGPKTLHSLHFHFFHFSLSLHSQLTWGSRTLVPRYRRRVRETGTHTGWCPPAPPTRLSRRELALARFARFGLLGSPQTLNNGE